MGEGLLGDLLVEPRFESLVEGAVKSGAELSTVVDCRWSRRDKTITRVHSVDWLDLVRVAGSGGRFLRYRAEDVARAVNEHVLARPWIGSRP